MTKRYGWNHEKLTAYHIYRRRGFSHKVAAKAALRGWAL